MAAQIPSGFVCYIEDAMNVDVLESMKSAGISTTIPHFQFLIPHSPLIISTNRSNKTDVSLGPAQASGWNWTEKALYSG